MTSIQLAKIRQVIQSNDPHVLQQYVKTYMSNDPTNLQRIYKQLEDYHIKIQQLIHKQTPNKLESNQTKQESKPKPKTGLHSSKTKSYSSLRIKKKVAQDPTIVKSKKLLRMLQDKLSLKLAACTNQEFGLKIFEEKQKKIIKPLKENPNLNQNKNPTINRQIQRFYINKQYYQNEIIDVQINQQNAYDREMKQFLDRRKRLIQNIKEKKLTQTFRNKNYEKVPSRFLNTASSDKFRVRTGSLPTLSKLDKHYDNLAKLNPEIEQLMLSCQKFVQKPKKQELNMFVVLDEKVKLLFQSQDQIQRNLLYKAIVDQKKNSYNKYNYSFMKTMTSNIRPDRNCRLNKHQKDLLQNQLKMRHIINFSQK